MTQTDGHEPASGGAAGGGAASGGAASGGQARLLAASLRAACGPEAGALCLAAAQIAGRHLRFDAADPLWPDRDRMIVEPALASLGSALADLSHARELCQTHGPAIGCGVGSALAERMLAARFGRSLVDHRSWVLTTGAALATGPVQEAAWLGGAWRLGRVTVIAGCETGSPPGLAGFAHNGWAVRRASAADPGDIAAALSAALRSLKPTLILCVGAAAAPEPLGAQADAAGAWAAAGSRLAGVRRAWLKRLARHASRQDFETAAFGRLHGRWHAPLSEPGPLLPPGQGAGSTAQAMRGALAALPAAMPELVVLPGDQAWPLPPGQTEPPAATRAAAGALTSAGAATLFGAALHGGLLPLATQAAEALPALLPALREAAFAGIRLVHIIAEPALPAAGTRAVLRAMPNLFLFRPADASEALECLELAIRRSAGPSVLLASATPCPLLADRPARTRSARGGYVAVEIPGPRAATLIASGPEIHVAIRAHALLAGHGIPAAVVSLPCWDLFALQDEAWRREVLGSAPRFGLEPGSGFGWDRWLGPHGLFLAECDDPRIVADAVLRHLGCG